MKKHFIILILFIAFACDEETPFIKLKKPKESYYTSEIFSEQNLAVYGQWTHTKISCGWSGDEDPDFRHLEITEYGMYSVSSTTEILEYGKIEIVEQTDTYLIVNFSRKGGKKEFLNAQNIQITVDGNKLELRTPVADGCNRIFKHFD